jgi:DNA-binding NtrC family response regulator
MQRPRLILVDGDPVQRAALRGTLEERGYEVLDAATSADGLLLVGPCPPDAVVAASHQPGNDAAATVHALRAMRSDAAVVATIPPGGIAAGVDAVRAGAASWVVRPLDGSQVALAVDKALEHRRLARDHAALREQLRRRHVVVGAAPELQLLREVVRRAAPTKAPVLVTGETGTGRELVAQVIHEASPRRDRPFVRVSCAGLSETLLEAELFGCEAGALPDATARCEGRIAAADGGTLFLAEVSQLSPALQVKLLRVLQQGELERVGGAETVRVDVRVVAATSRDLAAEVHAGRFRDDLYYRLCVVSVSLPPLRERKGDIPALVEHLAARAAAARGLPPPVVSPDALSTLFAYDWPGNVRELQRAIDVAVARAGGRQVGPEHLPPVLHGGRADERTTSALIPGATLFEIEREAILRTLDEVGGSTARAAEVLGISVRKIQYRLKEYKAGQTGGRRRKGELAEVG